MHDPPSNPPEVPAKQPQDAGSDRCRTTLIRLSSVADQSDQPLIQWLRRNRTVFLKAHRAAQQHLTRGSSVPPDYVSIQHGAHPRLPGPAVPAAQAEALFRAIQHAETLIADQTQPNEARLENLTALLAASILLRPTGEFPPAIARGNEQRVPGQSASRSQ